MTNRQTLVLSVIATAAIIVGCATYYFLYFRPAHEAARLLQQKQAVDVSLSDAKKMMAVGQSSEAIPSLENDVAQAADKGQESVAKINLGIAYYSAGMPEKGVALLKEVSTNVVYPMAYRSTAGQQILEYYISSKDTDFALKNIFTGIVWGDFIKESNPDAKALELGVINAFEWVSVLGPSFSTEYVLASKYAALANETTDSATKTKYQNLAIDHVKKGDDAYQYALKINQDSLQKNPNLVPPFVDYRLGVGLEHKALTLSLLYEQKVSSIELANVESAFKDALTILEKDPNLKGNIVSGIFTRYHLAAFYAHIGSAQYASKILSTLAPMYNPSVQDSNFFQSFLKNYGTDKIYYKTQDWKDIVALSKIDPKFKSLLLSLGWKSSDLQ
jgi:tetratricopeptide (TPR) repeat protein